MSASSADLLWLDTKSFYILAIGGVIGIFFTTLKVLFGSYSLPHILREHKKLSHIEKTYNKMFRSRDNYCYHIAAARARGENEEAKRLAKDLVEFEKEIDRFEEMHFSKGKMKVASSDDSLKC